MDIKSIIAKKRAGGPQGELSKDEIKYFIGKWMKGEITDSQAAALLSYIYIRGLTEDEIINFVKASTIIISGFIYKSFRADVNANLVAFKILISSIIV